MPCPHPPRKPQPPRRGWGHLAAAIALTVLGAVAMIVQATFAELDDMSIRGHHWE